MDKILIGVFGAWRGKSYIDLMREFSELELMSVCEKDEGKLREAKDSMAKIYPDARYFTEFDDFLEDGVKRGMHVMLLCNYFHEHASYAIRAMQSGIHVVSECTAAATMKECVELVRCAEKTGMKYMLAENYPFTAANLEMERLCRGGTFGRILYAEGEYNHTAPANELYHLTPTKYHWRGWMPRTYYVTHAMGPLMYMSKAMPVEVNGRAVHSDLLYEIRERRKNFDGVGMMFCQMDNGAIFRFTGCTAMASDSGYRIVGEKGSAETGRSLGGNVRVLYHSFTTPPDTESVRIYTPTFHAEDGMGEIAAKAGHGGGDFWVLYNMIRYIKDDIEPFFNVYRAVAMSATAILAWRSCLDHGRTYAIPDFTRDESRKIYENDGATPFPDENGNGADVPPALPVW